VSSSLITAAALGADNAYALLRDIRPNENEISPQILIEPFLTDQAFNSKAIREMSFAL
jgi:hypothetical protein